MYIAPCNWKNKKLKKKTKWQAGQQLGQQPGQCFQVGQCYNAPWCPRAMMEPLLMSSFFSLVMACLPPFDLAPPVPVLSPVVSPSSSASFVKPYFLNRFLLKVFRVRSLATLSGSEKESILSDVFKWVNRVTFKQVNSYCLSSAV